MCVQDGVEPDVNAGANAAIAAVAPLDSVVEDGQAGQGDVGEEAAEATANGVPPASAVAGNLAGAAVAARGRVRGDGRNLEGDLAPIGPEAGALGPPAAAAGASPGRAVARGGGAP